MVVLFLGVLASEDSLEDDGAKFPDNQGSYPLFTPGSSSLRISARRTSYEAIFQAHQCLANTLH